MRQEPQPRGESVRDLGAESCAREAWRRWREGLWLEGLRWLYANDATPKTADELRRLKHFHQELAEILHEASARSSASPIADLKIHINAALGNAGRNQTFQTILNRFLESCQVEVINGPRLETLLRRAVAASNKPPSNKVLRNSVLFTLRAELQPAEELNETDFSLRIKDAQRRLCLRYNFQWRYDDAHLRRYMCQYGFMERRADGRAYWLSNRHNLELVFDDSALALARNAINSGRPNHG